MTATKLDGLVASKINGVIQTRHENFEMKLPKFVKHACTWGEDGVAKIKSETSPKIKDKWIAFLFVGHAESHD